MSKFRVHLHKRERSVHARRDPLAPIVRAIERERAADREHGPVWFSRTSPNMPAHPAERQRSRANALRVERCDKSQNARAALALQRIEQHCEKHKRASRASVKSDNPFLSLEV